MWNNLIFMGTIKNNYLLLLYYKDIIDDIVISEYWKENCNFKNDSFNVTVTNLKNIYKVCI